MSMADVLTTRARAWRLEGRGGRVLGFTDHDRDLVFDGLVFRASAGMTAKALVLTTGLSVDNTEAAGALSDAALSEPDILAGHWDGARLEIWELDWQDPADRRLLFRGQLGEITREGGAFKAELRGLAEALQATGGRVYGRACPAVLGDGQCRFNLGTAGFACEAEIVEVIEAGGVLRIAAPPGSLQESVVDGWFAEGRVRFLDGAAEGLEAVLRADHLLAGEAASRRLGLWAAPGAIPAVGDRLRLEAGCDKRFSSCAGKFGNAVNFRGFPHVPSEDWLFAAPKAGAAG